MWQIFQLSIFICVLVTTIRESSDKQFVLRIVKALAFIHQPDLVTLKASDVSAGDWLYQHTWKNTIFFHVCSYDFSKSRKSLYNTAVYVINVYWICSLGETLDKKLTSPSCNHDFLNSALKEATAMAWKLCWVFVYSQGKKEYCQFYFSFS